MSRTRVSPNLRRRGLHDEPTESYDVHERNAYHGPDRSLDRDLNHDSVDGIGDLLNVDDEDSDIRQQKGLYPDLTEFQAENASFIIKTDERGTLAAGQYVKIVTKRRDVPGTDSSDSTGVPKESGSFHLKSVVSILIVLVALAIVIPYLTDTEVKHVKPVPTQVTEIVSKLKKEYVNQPSLSFRIIKKALESVLAMKNRSEPLAPAVLLLMSTKGAEAKTASFAEELAELVASGNGNYQTIYGDQLHTGDPDRAKKEIDDLIKGAPKYNRQIVVLIRNLDVIPSKAVMMLHSYCDHENAPFKNAVFIMTINTGAEVSKCESKHFDEAAESHLTRVWGDLSKDMLSALLSRITVSVAAIYHKTKPELCR